MDRGTVVLTPQAVNRMDRDAFMRAVGPLFEHSPWVAERAWSARPFAHAGALHDAMVAVVRSASPAEQIELLRAHPDLAGTAARAGRMTASSVAEQASAGLDRLSGEEYERFTQLNTAYREKFGVPFIIAARRHDKTSILNAFESRLRNTREAEVSAARAEVFDITRVRLERLLPDV